MIQSNIKQTRKFKEMDPNGYYQMFSMTEVRHLNRCHQTL